MKKVMIMLFVLLFVSTIYAEINPMSFGINFGVVTDEHLKFNPLLWTAGAELDFQLGKFLMFSPEMTLIGYKFEFKQFVLFPAVILNFTTGPIFAGGGLTKGFYIGSGSSFAITKVALKLNAGFLSRTVKLTTYLITPFENAFDEMLVGATLGFRF
jgi:hypothetical protein